MRCGHRADPLRLSGPLCGSPPRHAPATYLL